MLTFHRMLAHMRADSRVLYRKFLRFHIVLLQNSIAQLGKILFQLHKLELDVSP